MTVDWSTIISAVAGIFAGGGIWAVIKARIDKKKTPYDMLMEMIAEQKKFYAEKNAEYEREKRDSIQKSYILSQTRKCAHRFKDPAIPCPVDAANEERLQSKCANCEYNEEANEPEQH